MQAQAQTFRGGMDCGVGLYGIFVADKGYSMMGFVGALNRCVVIFIILICPSNSTLCRATSSIPGRKPASMWLHFSFLSFLHWQCNPDIPLNLLTMPHQSSSLLSFPAPFSSNYQWCPACPSLIPSTLVASVPFPVHNSNPITSVNVPSSRLLSTNTCFVECVADMGYVFEFQRQRSSAATIARGRRRGGCRMSQAQWWSVGTECCGAY